MPSTMLQSLKMEGGKYPTDHEDWDMLATSALELARRMAPGLERNAALKKAGLLRVKADAHGLAFARRGRPPK
jgi:hypothetical protein